jgi:seryl-tRNA synthetase
MSFKDSYRLEKVYYDNIVADLEKMKQLRNNPDNESAIKQLIENAISDNESIILIYKNLGELYSENQEYYNQAITKIEELNIKLEALETSTDEKIDALYDYIATIPALPTVTSEDNGRVLMVVDGTWIQADLPMYSGESQFIPDALGVSF